MSESMVKPRKNTVLVETSRVFGCFLVFMVIISSILDWPANDFENSMCRLEDFSWFRLTLITYLSFSTVGCDSLVEVSGLASTVVSAYRINSRAAATKTGDLPSSSFSACERVGVPFPSFWLVTASRMRLRTMQQENTEGLLKAGSMDFMLMTWAIMIWGKGAEVRMRLSL